MESIYQANRPAAAVVALARGYCSSTMSPEYNAALALARPVWLGWVLPITNCMLVTCYVS